MNCPAGVRPNKKPTALLQPPRATHAFLITAVTLLCGTPFPASAILDDDGNGLSDVWQALYQLGPLAPDDDLDGDGHTTGEEAKAGTDPLDADSRLFIRDFFLNDDFELLSLIWPSQPCKAYQVQATDDPAGPWNDLGPERLADDDVMSAVFDYAELFFPPNAPGPGGLFLQLRVSDRDEDNDTLTAWEEKIIGTSDNNPDTLGAEGGDVGVARAWVDGEAPLRFELHEVALAHLGGSPAGPVPTRLVTATGSAAWIKLTSWGLDFIDNEARFLRDSTALDGYHAQLQPLKPDLDPDEVVRPFLLGRLTEGGNLWLRLYELDGQDQFVARTSRGYGANAGVQVLRYAMTSKPRHNRPGHLVVTPVVVATTTGSEQLRVVTWSATPSTGELAGLSEGNPITTGRIASNTAFLDVDHLQDDTFVVTYATTNDTLASLIVNVADHGQVTQLGLLAGASGLNIRGVNNVTVPAQLGATVAFTTHGYLTATLQSPNNNFLVNVWEERPIGCEPPCLTLPHVISTQNQDLDPTAAGVQLNNPALTDSGKQEDRFGDVLATGDFNGDGFGDLAVGLPRSGLELSFDTREDAGEVNIFHGSGNGYSTNQQDQTFRQGVNGLADIEEEGDNLGFALAVADFNGDNYDDLAMGAPGESVDNNTIPRAGAVHVLYGGTNGLTTVGQQFYTQDSGGMEDTSESGDQFGYALAADDFNNDGFADLAVGVPLEDLNGVTNAGAVQVIYGSSAGLSAAAGTTGNELRHQDSPGMQDVAEEHDRFGQVLATGNFDFDAAADLVVGIPLEDVDGIMEAGAVQVIHGSSSGALSQTDTFITQAEVSGLGVDTVQDQPETNDTFGDSLVAGDFNGDGFDELAVGVPREDIDGNSLINGGAVHVFWGTVDGLLGFRNQFITQDGIAQAGASTKDIQEEAEEGDNFGFALAAGDYDGDGVEDLFISVPFEDLLTNTVADAGGVHVLLGSDDPLMQGLSPASNQFYTEGSPTWILGTAEASDTAGRALAAPDVDQDGFADLAMGIPFQDIIFSADTDTNAGVVTVIYGQPLASGGLTGTSQVLGQVRESEVRARLADATDTPPGAGEAPVLFEKRPVRRPELVHNASVTKNMTLLLAVEAILSPDRFIDLDDMVTISELAAQTGGSMMEPDLFQGDIMPLELLMYGMMLQSGNRASVAIAEHVALSATNFVVQMNQRAADLGMTRTTYGHPAGGCVSPPEDQLRLWNFARQYPLFREFTTATNFSGCGLFAGSNLPKCYDQPKLPTSNPPYPGLGGWKGGAGRLWWLNDNDNWTDLMVPNATSAVVSETTRLGRNLQVSLQQTGNRWTDHNNLMDFGYRKLFTPDFRSVAQALAIPSTNDFDLTLVGRELAVFAFVQGTRLRVASFGINDEPRFFTFQFPQSHTIDDLPEGNLRIPTTNIDADRLAPGTRSIADVVTARHDANHLRLELWRLGAQPGF